jgi:hypothetical protein
MATIVKKIVAIRKINKTSPYIADTANSEKKPSSVEKSRDAAKHAYVNKSPASDKSASTVATIQALDLGFCTERLVGMYPPTTRAYLLIFPWQI